MKQLLDLCCGAGGCSVGYDRAGFEVTGVDHIAQPNYPYRFYQRDAIETLQDTDFLQQFDVIHISPPCQAMSVASGGKSEKTNILPIVQHLCRNSGIPYIIENVPNAVKFGLRCDVVLLGTMFGLKVIRKRVFEIGNTNGIIPFFIPKPDYARGKVQSGEMVTVAGMGYKKAEKQLFKGRLKDHPNMTILETRKMVMGMDWVNIGSHDQMLTEVNNAIPPQYTEYIGKFLLEKYFKT